MLLYSVVTRKLEDVLDAKNGAIKDLQYELARVCKAHNDLLRTYEVHFRVRNTCLTLFEPSNHNTTSSIALLIPVV